MAKMVLKSTEEINHGRKRARLVFTLAIIPFLLVAGFMAWKVATMYINTQEATEKFNLSQLQETPSEEKTKLINETIDLVDNMDTEVFAERWIVSYNYGTALVAGEKNTAGIEKLKQSLTEIDPNKPEICFIYANLAIGYEKLGDEQAAAGDKEQAAHWYEQSLLVTDTASMCSPPPNNDSNGEDNSDTPTPDQQGGESLQNTKDRVTEKQNGLNGQPDQDSSEQENPEEQETDPNTPDQGDLDKVREQMDESADEKAQQEAGKGDSSSGGNAWDKPW